ncbi:hypothetical protein [Sphingomonas sp. RS2018]
MAVAVVGGGGFLLGQRSAIDQQSAVQPVAVGAAPSPSPAADTLAAPGRTEILGRAEMLTLAREAADAAARGDAMPAGVRDAVGKSFAITLPFGCEGPVDADSEAPMHWRYDEAAGALRLNVTPVRWSPDEWFADGSSSKAETIEGFWILRPWTRSEVCPAAPTAIAPSGAEPITLAGQTLAIGQVFGADDARQGRRDSKAYASVLRMARTEFDGSRGLGLRLSGRVVAGPTGSAVACRQPGGADQRPVCLLQVSLEEVAIADPTSDKVLSTWRTGSLRDDDGAR